MSGRDGIAIRAKLSVDISSAQNKDLFLISDGRVVHGFKDRMYHQAICRLIGSVSGNDDKSSARVRPSAKERHKFYVQECTSAPW